MTPSGSSPSICEYVKETGETGLLRPGRSVCRQGRRDGLRAHEAFARFFGGADRADRHLPGPPGRLERLPEPGRRGERHGLLPASLGADDFHRGRPLLKTRRGRAEYTDDGREGEEGLRGEAVGRRMVHPRHHAGRDIKIGSNEEYGGEDLPREQQLAVLSGRRIRGAGQDAMDSVHKHLFSKYGIHLCGRRSRSLTMTSATSPGSTGDQGKRRHLQPSRTPGPWSPSASSGGATRALKLYDALLPYNQNDLIEVREAEPYSYASSSWGRTTRLSGRAPSLADRNRRVGLLCRNAMDAGDPARV